jgi:uncharacterized membrane protein
MEELLVGILAGVFGSIVGTGYKARATLARVFGHALPAALIEDVVVLLGVALR